MTVQYVTHEVEGGVPIRAWTRGVPVEEAALEQLRNTARLPIIHHHVAAMPDTHWGIGATVGSVIPTIGAIIPAAVGCDIGCGMVAVRTNLRAGDLPDSLAQTRAAIETAVPHGRTNDGGANDRGAWADTPTDVGRAWLGMERVFRRICEKHPTIAKSNNVRHLGTLGTGNHFIEVCLDEDSNVWVMLHSGSRGVGGRIGNYFIELAKKDALKHDVHLPDKNLAYLREGAEHFDDYVEAVEWAQNYAATNRLLMLQRVLFAMDRVLDRLVIPRDAIVQCHHNYCSRERHFEADVWLTRKGAVSAREGELGIIPGSMGAKSFIVRGKGNADSFHTCSHGAGRVMSRTAAKKVITLEDHAKATEGVECRKDLGVIDESPAAYKSIDAVMEAQRDLVDVVHVLKQIVCIKG